MKPSYANPHCPPRRRAIRGPRSRCKSADERTVRHSAHYQYFEPAATKHQRGQTAQISPASVLSAMHPRVRRRHSLRPSEATFAVHHRVSLTDTNAPSRFRICRASLRRTFIEPDTDRGDAARSLPARRQHQRYPGPEYPSSFPNDGRLQRTERCNPPRWCAVSTDLRCTSSAAR